jgi:hypothetical protein
LSLPVPDKYFISVCCANTGERHKAQGTRHKEGASEKLQEREEEAPSQKALATRKMAAKKDLIWLKGILKIQFEVLNELI